MWGTARRDAAWRGAMLRDATRCEYEELVFKFASVTVSVLCGNESV